MSIVPSPDSSSSPEAPINMNPPPDQLFPANFPAMGNSPMAVPSNLFPMGDTTQAAGLTDLTTTVQASDMQGQTFQPHGQIDKTKMLPEQRSS